MPFLFHQPPSMLSEGAKTEGGRLCCHGDGNTRLHAAVAVLCNGTVTMTMFRGWTEGTRGEARASGKRVVRHGRPCRDQHSLPVPDVAVEQGA